MCVGVLDFLEVFLFPLFITRVSFVVKEGKASLEFTEA